MTATAEVSAPVDAIGTRLRLRALVAMGHSAGPDRPGARPVGMDHQPDHQRPPGQVSPQLRADALALYDIWWCLRPPETTPAERAAATAARARAERGRWSQPLGLDDEHLDTPGYRPRGTYRPAEGVGVATDPDPLGRRSA